MHGYLRKRLAGAMHTNRRQPGRSTLRAEQLESRLLLASPIDQLTAGLRITELMYQPTEPPLGSPHSPSDFEFVELTNIGDDPLDLAGVSFVEQNYDPTDPLATEGINFDFTGTILAPGTFVLIVDNQAAFESRYGTGVSALIAGEFSGKLRNEGEHIKLVDTADETVILFEYNDGRGWTLAATGAGHSMVPQDFAITAGQDNNSLDYGANWRASSYINGSPGVADPALPAGVLLNEIMAHTDFSDLNFPDHDSNDWIELYNTSGSTITLNDYYLSDESDNLDKWAIPPGTQVTAGGYISFDETNDFHNPIGTGFGLNKDGEQVFLSHLPSGSAGRIVDSVQFKGQENDVSLGRLADGSGFWLPSARSRDQANQPAQSHVVISEIMYNPPGVGTYEYVELYNPTGQTVTFQNGVGPWRFDGAVDYDFPAGVSLAAGGRLLVVDFNPANIAGLNAFEATYGTGDLVPGVDIIGPYDGNLSNGGERLALERPQAPDMPGEPNSWVIVDEAIYFDKAPWPVEPDGNGDALIRVTTSADRSGNDPANWQAGATLSPIESFLASPNPVTQDNVLNLTVEQIADPYGSPSLVGFYRDANGNGSFDEIGDTLLGLDSNPADGWSLSVSTAGWPLGTNHYFTRMQYGNGNWSSPAVTTGAITNRPNVAPSIGSLIIEPDPATQGDEITLTAQNVQDSDGSVSQVEFYRDINSNGSLDIGTDTLLGTDSSSAGGWSWTGPTGGFTAGSNVFFARAQDNNGTWSAATGATGLVESPNIPPTIESLTALPALLIRGLDTLTLTASGVSDDDGDILQVEFYRDTNGNGSLDTGVDTLLVIDTNPAGGWSWTVPTDDFSAGMNIFFARAQDNNTALSGPASANIIVELPNQPPTIGELLAVPASLNDSDEFTLTASSLVDIDGTVATVEFYYDSNDNDQLDTPGDTLLETDTNGADGWSTSGSADILSIGVNRLFARAQDDDGDWGETAATMVSVELTPAEITVLLDSTDIADGLIEPIDFGQAPLGEIGPSFTFTVRNDGQATLELGQLTVPNGFLLIEGLAGSLATGQTDSFTVQLDTATSGYKSGQLTLGNNDSDENPFDFDVSGLVLQEETFGGLKTVRFTVTGSSEATVRLIGPGEGRLLTDGTAGSVPDIILDGTSNRSMLMVTTAGPSTVLGDITINGSLNYLFARTTDLAGRLDIADGSLSFLMIDDMADGAAVNIGRADASLMVMAGDLGDVSFDIAGSVRMFLADSIAGGSLTAADIGMLLTRTGGLGSDLRSRSGDIGQLITAGPVSGDLDSAGRIGMIFTRAGGLEGSVSAASNIDLIFSAGNITGDINSGGSIRTLLAMGSDITGTIRAASAIGTVLAENLLDAVLAAGDDVRLVSISSNITDSYVLAGYDIGDDLAFGAGDIGGDGNVGMIIARGRFSDSYVGAGMLPPGPLTGFLPAAGEIEPGRSGSIALALFGSLATDPTDEYGLYAPGTIRIIGFKPDEFFAH